MSGPKITFFRGKRQNEEKWDVVDTNNLKVKSLQALATEVTVVPTCTIFEETLKQYNRALEDFDYAANSIIVGHSLGGYWAYKFAQETNRPLILLNPSMNPRWYKEELNILPMPESTIFFTAEDEVVSSSDTYGYLTEKGFKGMVFRLGTGDHRFNDSESLSKLGKYINNYVPCIV